MRKELLLMLFGFSAIFSQEKPENLNLKSFYDTLKSNAEKRLAQGYTKEGIAAETKNLIFGKNPQVLNNGFFWKVAVDNKEKGTVETIVWQGIIQAEMHKQKKPKVFSKDIPIQGTAPLMPMKSGSMPMMKMKMMSGQ